MTREAISKGDSVGCYYCLHLATCCRSPVNPLDFVWIGLLHNTGRLYSSLLRGLQREPLLVRTAVKPILYRILRPTG